MGAFCELSNGIDNRIVMAHKPEVLGVITDENYSSFSQQ